MPDLALHLPLAFSPLAEASLAAIFWISAGLIVFTYGVYAVVIAVLSRLFGRTAQPAELSDANLPKLSLLIAAYNEEKVIEERIHNALAMDYPKDRLEIAIASDGSADRTSEIVRRYEDRGIRFFDYKQRRGKTTVLNTTVEQLTGDILLMSDANTYWKPDAARKLARWFQDPNVGAVCGKLILNDPVNGKNADGVYWKYETFLKVREGRLGALLGSNGAIYAIRRDKYTEVPPGTIVDDFVIPLLAKQRTGCAIVYDAEAVAEEETAPDIKSEFHRRARIGAGGFQAIALLWRLLNPARGWVAFTFFSHKVLRWFCPLFMILALVSSGLLWANPLYRALFLAQLAFYAIAMVGPYLPAASKVGKMMRVCTMFVSMNLALLIGAWRWLRGSQGAAWRRTARSVELSGAAS